MLSLDQRCVTEVLIFRRLGRVKQRDGQLGKTASTMMKSFPKTFFNRSG